MRSSSLLFIAGFVVFGAAAAASGCSSETDGAGGSSASSTTTSSQASNGSTGSSMAGSGGSGTTGSAGGGEASSSSSSSGAGGAEAYSSCGDCSNTGDGAPTKECKAQNTACTNDMGCDAIRACWNNCATNHDGGCCTLDCYTSTGANQASIDLFKAFDKCVYCTTCKTLCTDPPDYDAVEYCKVVEGTATCP